MEISIEDIQDLAQVDKEIADVCEETSQAIDEEVRLEVVLLQEMRRCGGKIAQSMSQKGKFMQLYMLTDSVDVQGWVDDWFRAEARLRKLDIKLRQLEGRRDSIKKKLTVYREMNI